MSLKTERIEIPTSAGGTMGGFLSRPDSDEILPAVIVYMEIFGINSHIRDLTERVAQEGFVAIAPDYFHRTGPGIELDYDDVGMAAGMQHLGKLDADQMIADARDTVAFLRARDDVRGDRIGCMGFCIGGHMAFLTACETEVRATASFYGGGIAAPQGPGGGKATIARCAGIRGPIHCYFGGQDAMIPQAQVAAIHSSLEASGKDHEIVVYDDADHGFHCDQRMTYHEPSAKDAWKRTIDLFNEQLWS